MEVLHAACTAPEDAALVACGRGCEGWALPVLTTHLAAPAVLGQLRAAVLGHLWAAAGPSVARG